MKRPFFSIVIPTKARLRLVWMTIHSLLAQSFRDFEIIVSDNDSVLDCKKCVQAFSDERIRYYHTPKDLSMADNWRYGISFARGEYVGFIQDKMYYYTDSLQIFYDQIKAHHFPATVFSGADFAYLCHQSDQYEGSGFILRRKERTGRTRIFSSDEMVDFILRWGACGNELLWTAYASIMGGVVHRNVIDSIEDKYGTFFLSDVPDFGQNLIIAAIGEKHVALYDNLSVMHAVSPEKSNGANCAQKYSCMRDFTSVMAHDCWKHAVLPGYHATNLNLVTGEHGYLIDRCEELRGKRTNRLNALIGISLQKTLYDLNDAPTEQEEQIFKDAIEALSVEEKRIYESKRKEYASPYMEKGEPSLNIFKEKAVCQCHYYTDMKKSVSWKWIASVDTSVKEFCHGKKVYCYGAGEYGEKVFLYLQHLGIEIEGFLVSTTPEISSLHDRSVLPVCRIEDWSDTSVILGLDYVHHESVRQLLEEHGCRSIFGDLYYPELFRS
ncbi:glycosyl transferase family protein [Centipeda periodontii DSM 2778]|uniref:Glycosyl transferase family protein n=1 Tax=Centipeda periodontii DSM 2778 TaxID=888060 RepID=F5RQD0_9FIRM|nr:glycosyltransferase family A protein [Centipeda periodontii]EGK56964.1 glycosyl transferase family protein [Centipeda periodontii DSM 2778]